MEKNIDRHTLTFGKGMTTSPNDMLCSDNEADVMIGLTVQDGSLVPIQSPVKIGKIPYKIMQVHKGADYENIIAYENNTIYYYKRNTDGTISVMQNSFEVGDVSDIKSVGNTLVCATDKGLHYLLYKGGTYKDLGNELPKPDVKFGTIVQNIWVGGGTSCNLKEIVDAKKMFAKYDSNGDYLTASDSQDPADDIYYRYSLKEDVDKQNTFQTAVQGHVTSRISILKEKNYFLFPFFVRYAIKLYDGTYARISNPILIYPTINRNLHFTPHKYNSDLKNFEEAPYGGVGGVLSATAPITDFIWHPTFARLTFKADIDIENWGDIVKEIVVFASDDVMPFYLDKDWKFATPDATNGVCYSNTLHRGDPNAIIDGQRSLNHYFSFNKNTYKARDVILPEYKSDKEIIDELLTKTQFYKLFKVDVTDSKYINVDDSLTGYQEAPILSYVVSNLTEQEQLSKDDYYGWTDMVATKMFPYNKRINLFGLNRKPFGGFSCFSPFFLLAPNLDDVGYYDIYVHISSDSIDAWVKADGTMGALPEMLDGWFYYPDPNATEMRIIKRGTGNGVTVKLKTHPMLNGAYSFNALPYPQKNLSSYLFDSVTEPIVDDNAKEHLDSQIFTSVVNNPFVFEASGDNTVGTGSILGITANTEAVSQGQFGQYPLLVFTTEGIYGMSVSSEGLYSNIYPISREVCNNADSITPTDKLVFFTSDKGLMAVSGGTCSCVSSQLSGRSSFSQILLGLDFLNRIKECKIAYDYKSSLLYLGTSMNTFVYNMKEGVFSAVLGSFENVVNDYPDNLIQKGSDVYSFSLIPNKDEDNTEYSGMIISRPLKLGGSTLLKSIRSIKHLYSLNDGEIQFSVAASNLPDVIQNGDALGSLGGKPWKYFALSYNFENLNARDYFACTLVETQTRRNDKMR